MAYWSATHPRTSAFRPISFVLSCISFTAFRLSNIRSFVMLSEIDSLLTTSRWRGVVNNESVSLALRLQAVLAALRLAGPKTQRVAETHT